MNGASETHLHAAPLASFRSVKLDNTVAADPAALTKAVNDASAG